MHHRLPSALALVLALALTGCADEPVPQIADPTVEPTTSAVESVTEAPTSSPTPDPEPETAQQFIRRWHEVSDAMQLTGDTAVYRSLGPECQPCLETADMISGYYEAGGFIRYDGTTVRSVERRGQVGGVVEFDVALYSSPSEYRESADGALKTFPGGANSIRMRLRQTGGEWLVADYSILAS